MKDLVPVKGKIYHERHLAYAFYKCDFVVEDIDPENLEVMGKLIVILPKNAQNITVQVAYDPENNFFMDRFTLTYQSGSIGYVQVWHETMKLGNYEVILTEIAYQLKD